MIAPNTLLQNRYLVTEQIGQGGMGAVYVATDQRFGSTVALKETFFTDAALRKAFEREARLLNRLRHPALPRVSDHFVEDEGQFLVMEFIAGDDLWDLLKTQGGAFPLKEVLGWADQLLDALDYLHTQEPPVIHRDIKPQNLKLTSRGQIILLDFGLAKGTPAQMSQVSATASVFGYSRNYAPLEQMQGTGTDTRSDLYSLAATLYHLMTGITPPDALTRAAAVLNGQPDPLLPANEAHTQVTPAVAQVLMRAMSQNSGHRPQTAEAMREALREAARQTYVTGSTTNVHSAPVTAAMSEQDTQLMEAAPIAPAVQEATVADAVPATSISESVKESALAESVVTSVSPAAKRSRSGRTLGIAAGALMLVLVGAVIYALTRRAAQTEPTEITQPAGNPQPEQANSNNQNALPPEQKANKPVASEKKRAAEPAKTKEPQALPSPPAPPTTVEAPPAPDPNPNRRRDNPYYDPAQVEEAKREAALARQRAREERRLAMEEKRRIQEQRRRERMRQP
ncbi:MAG: protein kinase [Acidobacteria bacterium]|nr:protein kinase [Acidobacteriota bacterium]